jgi:Mor family transcriptional regulator
MTQPAHPDSQDLWPASGEELMAGAATLAADAERWPRQMAELTDLLVDELRRAGAEHDTAAARRLAGRLMARIAREFGGSSLYLPKADALERTLRDARLWAEFDGTVDGPGGVAVLARREGLTTIHVYRILAVQRGLHRRAVQGALFDLAKAQPTPTTPETP